MSDALERRHDRAVTSGRVCVGMIAGPHGVRGLVRVRPFTQDPQGVVAYGEPTDATGTRSFSIVLKVWQKDHWLAAVEGVDDRTRAEAMRGTRLYVDRADLPEPEEEEYYHADLIGLPVDLQDGTRLGVVTALYDFGAGDVMEVGTGRGPVVLPFTREAVPVVDVAGGRIVAAPPPGLLEGPEEGA